MQPFSDFMIIAVCLAFMCACIRSVFQTLREMRHVMMMEDLPQNGTQEIRIFGPPGCGKTTKLSHYLRAAVEKFGAAFVYACSFTRAAAAELVGRNLPLPKDRIGTIHSFCYRALDNPQIADERIAEFNAGAPPSMQLSVSSNSLGPEDIVIAPGGTEGDMLYNRTQILRGQMVAPASSSWTVQELAFFAEWQRFKQRYGYLDYTDLLELALRNVRMLPGDPRVLVVDEGQDLTPLQLAVVRRWANYTDYFLICADDDQQIYSFTGCTPEAILTPEIPVENKRYLKQSYRVPRAVHAYAVDHISRVQLREPKEYLPRDADGEIRRSWGTYMEPAEILDDVERVVARGQTAMLLAPCSYQLATIRAGLMERGLPFHNPYRRKRGDWNPLAPSHGLSSTDRMLAYLKPRAEVWGQQAAPWTGHDLKAWTDLITSTGTLTRGAKRIIDALPEDRTVPVRQLNELFEIEALDSLIQALIAESIGSVLEWIEKRLTATRRKGFGYPLQILRAGGVTAVVNPPQIVLGTIHSVKGGQADHVWLVPDISARAYQRTGHVEGRDEVRRQFYVGMTRARQGLVICSPATGMVADLNWGALR